MEQNRAGLRLVATVTAAVGVAFGYVVGLPVGAGCWDAWRNRMDRSDGISSVVIGALVLPVLMGIVVALDALGQ